MAGRSLLWDVVVCASIAVILLAAIPFSVRQIGFTTAGPAKKSIAASMQSWSSKGYSIKDLLAWMQSTGAKGYSTLAYIVASAFGGIFGFLLHLCRRQEIPEELGNGGNNNVPSDTRDETKENRVVEGSEGNDERVVDREYDVKEKNESLYSGDEETNVKTAARQDGTKGIFENI